MSSSEKVPSLFCSLESPDKLSDEEITQHLFRFLNAMGTREDIMILPPDYTRLHSKAGKLTQLVAQFYNFVQPAKTDLESAPKRPRMDQADPPQIQILPALGTHAPMSEGQIKAMFGDQLASKDPNPFLVHDWRNDVVTIGHAPAEMVNDATFGMVNKPWPAQLNKHVWAKRHHDPQKQHKSLVLSIGQVVPHEVMGMANYNKNLFVGAGGVEAINMSHFIGAVYGMERMMGRASNPLRSILNYASEQFLEKELDLWYILTVMGTDKQTGELQMKGFYIGNTIECYNRACQLSCEVNFSLLDKPPSKMVVYLDEDEFHSTWLGNKAIYRTRMAIADGGVLVILAPGVSRFGEDDQVDKLIRRYGYVGTPNIMKAMKENKELKENLSAVAHLIHGSSEGRFRVVYCPGHLSRAEVESVGFEFGDLDEMSMIYPRHKLKDGWNTEKTETGENQFYFISNPALGLWAVKSRFEETEESATDGKGGDQDRVPVSISSNQQTVDGSGGVGGWARPPPAD